jgi:hypothetical protein
MGFWHTGYIEFHEPSGIDEWCRPEPTIYHCSHCGEKFDNPAALRQHRFQKHPYKRPVLHIAGTEIGSTPVTITQQIEPHSVEVDACSAVFLNGLRMPPSHLAGALSSLEHDTARIQLEGEGTTASFELRIEIAKESDLAGVEKSFLDVAKNRRMDKHAIELFIGMASQFNTAISYYDGICDYLYGVLIKEKSAEASLPYESYREKFTRAADMLQTINRPLAKKIGGLIEFHFNHFCESMALTPDSRVGYASQQYAMWLNIIESRSNSGIPKVADEKLEAMLTDWDTERLIRWSVMPSANLLLEKQAIENMLKNDLAEFDRTKLHVLLAEIGLASKNTHLVMKHARELRNSPSLATWAESAIEISKSWNQDHA